MKRKTPPGGYVLCLGNRGYKASLVVRKVYSTISDPDAESRGLIRVIDESGEDYLFPGRLFTSIEIPIEARQRMQI